MHITTNSNKKILIQFCGFMSTRMEKWHNKPYTENMHDKLTNMEYN